MALNGDDTKWTEEGVIQTLDVVEWARDVLSIRRNLQEEKG